VQQGETKTGPKQWVQHGPEARNTRTLLQATYVWSSFKMLNDNLQSPITIIQGQLASLFVLEDVQRPFSIMEANKLLRAMFFFFLILFLCPWLGLHKVICSFR